ncbi:MAG: hypothetical protein PHS97_02630, partial [Oscillospiraceae bacterium]|nr:hypothetical protein [Oscillospiraceae bacterium]
FIAYHFEVAEVNFKSTDISKSLISDFGYSYPLAEWLTSRHKGATIVFCVTILGVTQIGNNGANNTYIGIITGVADNAILLKTKTPRML